MKRLLSLIGAFLFVIALVSTARAENKPASTQPSKITATSPSKSEAKAMPKHHAGKASAHGKKKQEKKS